MEKEQFNTPILFMVFNRPDVTKIVFEEIRKLKPTKLFISADGPREGRDDDIEKCRLTREIVLNIDWSCEVKTLFRERNLGCQMAPPSAITWFFENVESGIILEDDCIPHPSFFPFCAELLEKYKDNEKIFQINATSFQENNKKLNGDQSYFFSNVHYLWSWAGWRRSWKYYDIEMGGWPESKKNGELRKILKDPAVYEYWERLWDKYYDGEKNSWDRPWIYAVMKQGGISINPVPNLSSNIGFGPEATHTKNPDSHVSRMRMRSIEFPLVHPIKIEVDEQADKFIYKHQYYIDLNWKDRLLGPVRRKFPKTFAKIKKLVK